MQRGLGEVASSRLGRDWKWMAAGREGGVVPSSRSLHRPSGGWGGGRLDASTHCLPPPPFPLSLAPQRGLSPPALGKGNGEGRGELRQTYFQGFNPFCLKDFFFAWGRLGLIRGETQGADKLWRMGGW